MAELSWKKVIREERVEVYTTEDGKVFEGDDAWGRSQEHEAAIENSETLDALLARDPADVKAAIVAHFTSDANEGQSGLWCFLDSVSKHLPGKAADQGSPLDPCSPQEVAAWEAWAKSQGYDMHEHPLHYLFVDKQTDAARQGWKAGLAFARQTVRA